MIEFKNFGFKYNAQVDYTLRDINLKINPGEKVLKFLTDPCPCSEDKTAGLTKGRAASESMPRDQYGIHTCPRRM